MDEDLKRWQIPAFGHWDHCDELPITQYFESAWQAGLFGGHSFREDADLFPAPAPAPAKPTQNHHQKVKKRGGGLAEQKQGKDEQRKQGSVWDDVATKQRRTPRAPKAVDEDLYKIPPELLYKKPKRKRLLRNLVSRCLGVLCIL